MNLRVNLTKRVMTAEGLRYCPAVESANGRIKPDVVMVDGKEERHSSGSYYLDWTEDGKRKRQQVGPDAAQAYARKLSEQARLNALANGIAIVPSSDETDGKGRAVNTAIADFVEETRLTKKKKTLYAYTKATEYFAESCQKRYLADIERIDMLRYALPRQPGYY